jgi:CheY-like chemotaxis protein
LDVAGDLPSVGIEPSVMRQMLLGLLSYLVGDLSEGEVWVRARPERDDVLLSLRATGRRRGRMPTPEGEDEAQLAMAQELARMQNIRVEQVSGQEGVLGFDLLVRSVLPQTILVVDDNEDVLQLYERFLSRNRYHVITARSADEALRLAESRRPAAITLDLMMPDPDGWEALQSLKNHPATQHIPVIVCSVLAAKTLALSLGAAAFLGKPVTEQSLLSALRAL